MLKKYANWLVASTQFYDIDRFQDNLLFVSVAYKVEDISADQAFF